MTTSKDLNVARKNLVASLGEKSKLYFDKMRLWFQMKTSKEEFDAEARGMMNEEQLHLHNEFLLCLFNKVRGLVVSTPPSRLLSNRLSSAGGGAAQQPSPGAQQPQQLGSQTQSQPQPQAQRQDAKERRLRLKRKYRSDRSSFEPADVYAEVLSRAASPAGDEPVGANRSSAQELVLPDRTFVLARLMLAAWEHNMDGAEDSTAHLIIAASHTFLKNLITAMVTRRKGYRVRDGSFIYGIGEAVPSSWRRSSAVLSREARFAAPTVVVEPAGQMPSTRAPIEEAEQTAAFAMACSDQNLQPPPPPLGIVDLQRTLRVHRNLVQNHTIYATNCERLFTYNTHSTVEDIEAQKLLA